MAKKSKKDETDQVAKRQEATLGKHTFRLSPPASFSVREEIVAAEESNKLRAYAAALGVCWRGKGKPKASYAACGYNPLVFGARVADELHARGDIDPGDLYGQGQIAWFLIVNSLPDWRTVEEQVGNSETEEDSTS